MILPYILLRSRSMITLSTRFKTLTLLVPWHATIVSNNGLLSGQHQAIMWTNARILLIGPLGTNFSEISIRMNTLSFKKINLKMSFAKWQAFFLSPKGLMYQSTLLMTIIAFTISSISRPLKKVEIDHTGFNSMTPFCAKMKFRIQQADNVSFP